MAAAGLSGLTPSLDTALGDLRFAAGTRAASGQVVLVDIDAKSLAEVGVWPWPRRLHGELVRAAAKAGAAGIAFDVDFSSASGAKDDALFAQALGESGVDTFLAAFQRPDTTLSGQLRASLPIAPLLDASWPVSVNVPLDGDGRVRRFPRATPIGEEVVAAMPSVLANREASGGEFGIDHGIEAATIPRVSYTDLLAGRVDPAVVRGKSLIVGASAIELHDLFPVPRAGIVSGSTVIALATETLLQDRALTTWTPPLALLLLVAAAGAVVATRCSMRRSLLVLSCGMMLVEALAVWLYVRDAAMLQTGGLHVALAGLVGWSAAREFGLRGLLLWKARRETQNTLRLLERVVDDGFDAVILADDAGRILRTNEAARRLLGLARDAGIEDLPAALGATLRRSMADLGSETAHGARLRGIEAVGAAPDERLLEYAVASFWLDGEAARGRPARRLRFGALMLRDVTERERMQETLRFAALHDSLTGLGNRRALEAALDARLDAGDPVTLLAFDLDRFKGVNDALGHATGDAVLAETARRAAAILPEDAALFRIGGDEFVVLLSAADAAVALHVSERLEAAIVQPLTVRGHRVSVGTSVGIAGIGDGCRDAATLRRRADVALYRAKRSAERRIVAFDAGMETARLDRLALEADLKQAIDSGAFEVAYQPQLRLSDRMWTGAEALVRWRHPERGFVSPAAFIPVAEEMGLIHELGARVLEIACRDAATWPETVRIAVNVSPLQLAAGDVRGAVRRALAASGLDPRRLELEITESAFVGENDRLASIFADLLSLGVTFALDDFGTGYSSLGYLHRFPISKIKIDRSFVIDGRGSRHSMAVLRSVMALADGLAVRTIAEGIETEDQADLLRSLGCGEGQGYLFSRPVDAASVAELLHGRAGAPRLTQAA
ncbi:EAL domain-containing protein [Aureimonas sp. AU4]|uniref:EAL domain-containing protein n=1 Tax=Aureimonas sp. AU4 TaxID=1638163 RepID=UPI000A937DC4|nr:EAL domain-containing protein [Aureimonas sp. AU4]